MACSIICSDYIMLRSNKQYQVLDSAKLRALRAHVPTCLACLHAHGPCVLTRQRVLHSHVPTFLAWLCALYAHVLTHLTSSLKFKELREVKIIGNEHICTNLVSHIWSDAFLVIFGHISQNVFVFIIDFEQVNTG